MKNTILSLVLLVLCASYTHAQTSRLELQLKDGAYKVGFKVYQEYDYGRTLSQTVYPLTNTPIVNKARPIQITVWYPAKPKNSEKLMPYANYIKLMATEMDFNYKGDPLTHPYVKKRGYLNDSTQKEQLKLLLAATSKVYENADALAGSFPVLIYNPGGFGSNFENATLCEYLASQGFIVAAYPNVGHVTTIAPPFPPPFFEEHARDLEFVIAFMHKMPNVDMQKLGIMGFSLGGSSGTTVMSRNSEIKAAVSLDGWHEPKNIAMMPFVDFSKMTIPYLNLARKIENNPNKIVYDSLKNQDKYFITFPTFPHPAFCSAWLMLVEPKDIPKGGQSQVNMGYSLECSYVFNFFKGYLMGDKASKEQLKTLHTQKDIPDGFLNFEYQEAGVKQ